LQKRPIIESISLQNQRLYSAKETYN